MFEIFIKFLRLLKIKLHDRHDITGTRHLGPPFSSKLNFTKFIFPPLNMFHPLSNIQIKLQIMDFPRIPSIFSKISRGMLLFLTMTS